MDELLRTPTPIIGPHEASVVTFSASAPLANPAPPTMTSPPLDDPISDEEDFEGGISSDDGINFNESGMEAMEQQMTRLELSTMAAEDIWALLNNKKCRGGYIARSVFIEGKKLEPKICDPWIGEKTLAKSKMGLIDQRSSFMQWAQKDQRVLTWIRTQIYTTVVQKPTTYRFLELTHADMPKFTDGTRKDGLTLEVYQATDDVMARVAHLACTPEGRVALNLIFGAIVSIFDAFDCVVAL
jgi:hypothetical protein